MLTIALRRVLGRPRLVLLLWLPPLSLSLLTSLPVYAVLRALLDDRPLAAALSRGAANFALGELFADQPTLAPLLLASLGVALVLGWLLSAVLAGGLLDALRRPGDPRRVTGRAVLARAGETAPAMLRLLLLGLLLRLPLLLLGGALALALRRLLPGRGMVPTLAAVAACGLVLGLLWSAVSVVLHYARLARLRDDGVFHRPTRRALLAGLRVACRTAPRTLLLGALSLGGLLLLLVLGRAIALRLDQAGAAAALVLAWRQLCALGRAALRLAVMAAAVEVVDAQQEGLDF